MSEEKTEIGIETIKRRLKVPLSKTDIAKRNEQLLSLWTQKDETEAEFALATAEHKQVKSAFEARISEFDKDMAIIRDQIKTGSEAREVECKEIPNHETHMIELHRLDVRPGNPQRIVSERPMDLLAMMEATPEATEEAQALADAASAIIKPKKAKTPKAAKEPKPKTEPKVKASGNGKAKKGKASVPGADMEGVEDLPPLVGNGASDSASV